MARKFPENEDDFIRMQQEAIRRVRDMQERARSTLESAGVPFDSLEASVPPAVPTAPVPPPRAVPSPSREGHSGHPVTQSVWTAPAPAMHPPSPAPESAERMFSDRVAAPPPVTVPRPSSMPHSAAGHAQFHSPIPPLLGNLLPAVNISLDSEQILLMVLMFLLYQDNSDKFLILALAYILLI